MDREFIIIDFKISVCNFMIVISVVVWGLDVKEFEFVVNYDVFNYYEDYVYCVGCIGCVGCKGCLVIFIFLEEERYVLDFVKVLEFLE